MKRFIPQRRDPLKALILERQNAYKRTDAWMASELHVSRQTWARMKARHTDEWTLAQIKTILIALNLTREQISASLTAQI